MHEFARTARARKHDRILAALLLICGAPVALLALTSVAQDSHYYGDGGEHLASTAKGIAQTFAVIASVIGIPLLLFKYWLSASVHMLVFGGAALAATRLA